MTEKNQIEKLVLKISGQQKIPDEIAKIFVSSLSSLKGFSLVKKIERSVYGLKNQE